MTKRKYKRYLSKELNRLNEAIDRKIMFGREYRYESRRHKALLQQARALKRNEWTSKIIVLFGNTHYNVR
jgi:hypothetical protein